MSKKQITTWSLIAMCIVLFSISQISWASNSLSATYTEGCGPLSQEAEDGQLFGEMVIGEDKRASGGKFVFTPEKIEGSDFYNNPHKVEFCVEIPESGEYQIKTWVFAHHSNFDSMFVAVDNQPEAGYLWDAVVSKTFSEDMVSDRKKSDPQTIKLTAGAHILTFANRESGTKLDRFELIQVGGSGAEPPTATSEPLPTDEPTTEPTVVNEATPTSEPTEVSEATPTKENQCGGLEQEAEEAVLFGGMTLGQYEKASGGKFIYVPASYPHATKGIDPEHRAEFCVEIDQAGDYQIMAWAQAPNSKQDSLYVTINDSPAGGYLWQPPTSDSFKEDWVHNRGKTDPQTIRLAKGEHKLTFFHRESETKLDKFKFVLVSEPVVEATPTVEIEATPTAVSEETPIVTSEPTAVIEPTVVSEVTPTSEPTIPPSTCGGMIQEAEAGELFGGMTIGNHDGASGGRYVFTPLNYGKSTKSPNYDHRVEFCMTVPEDGVYKLIGRVQAATKNNDSFYVMVDGAPSRGYLWDVKRSSGFVNDAVNDRRKTDPQTFFLSAGEHTISFVHREPEAKLDRIELVLTGDEGAPIEPTPVKTKTPVPPTKTPVPTTVPPTIEPTKVPPTIVPTKVPPTVAPTQVPQVCGGLDQEAESAQLHGGMIVGYSGDASGGRYIFTPKSRGFAPAPDKSSYAEFCVTIDTAGEYQIEALVKANDDNADSFYVTVNDGPAAGYLWDVTHNSKFVTDFVNDRGKADPVTVFLAAGEHMVAVHQRESGTMLDKISVVPAEDQGSGGVIPPVTPVSTVAPTATPIPPVSTVTPIGGKVDIGMSEQPSMPPMFRVPDGVKYRQQYLAGGAGKGWTTWNANGDFVKYYMERSQQQGKSTIFTLYHMCQSGYDGVSNHPCYSNETQALQGNMSNKDTMRKYWNDLEIFYEKAAEFPNYPVILHFEPDLWGYIQKGSAGDDAANYSQTVQVSGSGHPALRGIPNTALGFADAIFHMRDYYNADNVLIAYHVSSWGNSTDFVYTNPSQSEMVKLGDRSAKFYKSLKQPFDMSFFEIRDRDAGFYEDVYNNPQGWWTSKDFDNHITYIDRYSDLTDQRIMLWQLPYGNTKHSGLNNSWGKYQDNIVETLFDEPNLSTLSRYQAAGVEALIFGQGAGGTTCPCDADGDGRIDDGGYFYDVVEAYLEK